MKELNQNSIPIPFKWKGVRSYNIVIRIVFMAFVIDVHAQEGTQGNTTIFSGAQMTFFGDHNFTTGGGGTMPGIINTERTVQYGVLNYSSASLTVTGADDANHVDGYVRNLGAGYFLYPVGDNGSYRPFGADGAGTTGAYFGVDPNSAVTSNLGGGNYPILPTSGPFPTADKQADIHAVSTAEYWDIDGSNPSAITLSWNSGSAVDALTNNKLELLTIVGWNPSTSQWEEIPSSKDDVSVLGGSSDLTAGSISTTANITPDTYTIYTLAGKVDPLPVTLVTFEATKEHEAAQLTWSTTSESNSSHFDIERSQNGIDWSLIGQMDAYGESTALRNYAFTDPSPFSGENLYRLKMVDLDDTFAYSRIRSLYFEGRTNELAVYPNPAQEYVTLQNPEQVLSYRLIGPNGQALLSDPKMLDTQGKLLLGKITPGMYVLKIQRKGGLTEHHKLVIDK
ncbi:putative secreted protein (Por secretion system target) [Dyadobacter jejuensis]|uniref:Putative secreted protein (Por secretion system target) n=1 Tax=Dyadobacter jejuensis TaxID=1082580 RepID=A0A316AQ38_9BACT|nr:T9SS type A sorting domain-containing protein [Dyadobacter jejuensis]PWJ59379.1 putative secreted protein (Por secretion system target) [Dyadobacter jejuensis]